VVGEGVVVRRVKKGEKIGGGEGSGSLLEADSWGRASGRWEVVMLADWRRDG